MTDTESFLDRINSRIGPIIRPISEEQKEKQAEMPGDLSRVQTLARWLSTYSKELESNAASAHTNNEALRNARARITELRSAVEDAAEEIAKVANERGLPEIK